MDKLRLAGVHDLAFGVVQRIIERDFAEVHNCFDAQTLDDLSEMFWGHLAGSIHAGGDCFVQTEVDVTADKELADQAAGK